jgi:2-methylcitrate dehydratase PrpD
VGELSLSEVLSQFIQEAPARMPADARNAGQVVFLDCLGAALGGAKSKATSLVHRYLTDLRVDGPCTVLGMAQRCNAEHAALANGVAAHVLDIDDTNNTMDGHPSVAALASSLAVAEAHHRSGAELVTAFVLSFEVQAKLASLLPRGLSALGWHNCGTLGTIGAAASAAFLLRLDAARTVHALGAAASMASGLTSNVGSMVKPLHAGLAARNGVFAAEIAALGFEAQRFAFDGPAGFVQAFTGQRDYAVDSDALGSRLGNPFDVLSPGTDLKLYASCNCTHAAIDAALVLRARAGAAAIREVVCRVPSLPSFLLSRLPDNRTEGKFSLEYCTALALSKGLPEPDDFEDGPILEGPTTDLMKIVRVEIAPEEFDHDRASSALPAAITLDLADGSLLSETVQYPRGSTLRPLADQEIDAKFTMLAGRLLPTDQAKAVLALVRQVDTLADVGTLSALLHPGSSSDGQPGNEPA